MIRALFCMRYFFALLTVSMCTIHVGAYQEIERITVVPIGGQLDVIPPEARPPLLRLLQIDEKGLEALIASDDPVERGMALFVLDMRGDVRRLLEVHEWLNDNRKSVSQGILGAASQPQYLITHQWEVSGYLGHLYQSWLGVNPRSLEHLHNLLDSDMDPEHLTAPWLRSLGIARARERRRGLNGDERPETLWQVDKPEAILTAIHALPPYVQWRVITAAAWRGMIERKEAAAMLRELPDSLQRKLLERDFGVEDVADPYLLKDHGQFLAKLLNHCAELLSDEAAGE